MTWIAAGSRNPRAGRPARCVPNKGVSTSAWRMYIVRAMAAIEKEQLFTALSALSDQLAAADAFAHLVVIGGLGVADEGRET